MPKIKRPRMAHTEEWGFMRQRTLWPEQYELLRPIVLFGDTPAERAEQTGAAERTLYRRADRFDQEGMMTYYRTTTVVLISPGWRSPSRLLRLEKELANMAFPLRASMLDSKLPLE